MTTNNDGVKPVPIDPLVEYRKQVQALAQKSQEDFDKTVLSLSGGALGISFVFLKDVIGQSPVLSPHLLFAAWVCWGLSTSSVLVSYFLSQLALRKTVEQIDTGTIYTAKTGGLFRTATATFNAVGGILFLAGVCAITLFANANIKTKETTNGSTQSTTTTPAITAPAPSSKPSAGSPEDRKVQTK